MHYTGLFGSKIANANSAYACRAMHHTKHNRTLAQLHIALQPRTHKLVPRHCNDPTTAAPRAACLVSPATRPEPAPQQEKCQARCRAAKMPRMGDVALALQQQM